MGFLLRSTFWLSLVLLLIPFGGEGEAGGQPPVGAVEALFAAREAIGDLSGLCERKPGVCEVGGQVMATIGVRAKEGARLAYEALDRNLEDAPVQAEVEAQPAVDPIAKMVLDEAIATGSVVRP